MDPNGKLFEAELEFLRSGVGRVEQVRASDWVGRGWSDKSKDNNSITELVDQIEVIILYRIGSDWIKSYKIRVSRYEWIES